MSILSERKPICQQPFAPMAWLGIYQNAEVNIFFLSIAFFLSKFSVYLFSSVSKTATGASGETLHKTLKKSNKHTHINTFLEKLKKNVICNLMLI